LLLCHRGSALLHYERVIRHTFPLFLLPQMLTSSLDGLSAERNLTGIVDGVIKLISLYTQCWLTIADSSFMLSRLAPDEATTTALERLTNKSSVLFAYLLSLHPQEQETESGLQLPQHTASATNLDRICLLRRCSG
jgi:hypothetical protein